VPDEANLWPQLTGIEALHLLGQVQGQDDEAYRDVLISRFEWTKRGGTGLLQAGPPDGRAQSGPGITAGWDRHPRSGEHIGNTPSENLGQSGVDGGSGPLVVGRPQVAVDVR
jgi:hypothetical protein